MPAIALIAAAPAWARTGAGGLIKKLKTAQGEEKVRVIEALGRSGKRKAVKPLLELLDVRGGSPRVNAAVVRALGKLGDLEAAEPLAGAWAQLNILRREMGEFPGQLETMRADVVEALGWIGGPRAGAVLGDALRDEDTLVVQKAAWGLGRLRERKAVEPLIQILPRGGDMAQAAYEALGELGDKSAAGALEPALRSEDFLTQAQAAYALAKLGKGGEKHLEKLVQSKTVEGRARVLAAYYQVKLDEGSGLDYLIDALKTGDASTRLLAAEALGKAGSRKAVLPLEQALDGGDAMLRLLVARSLGQLGGGRALHVLARLADDVDPTVRAAARMALTDLGESD